MENANNNQGGGDNSIIHSIMVEQEEKNREALNPLVVVSSAVNALREREREVLSLRYGLNDGQKTTLDAVGKKFNITRERVRQIEAAAIKRLAARPPKDLQALIKMINSHTIELGGMVSLAELSRYFRVEADPRVEAELNALRLVMSMNSEVVELGRGNMFDPGWVVKGFPMPLLPKLISELEKILKKAGEPVSEDVLWQEVLAGPVYGEYGAQLNRSVLAGVLRVAQNIGSTLDGKWGLKSWPTVAPKRIRDKVFLILQKVAQPMHFREIAEAINLEFPGRRVLSRTVHNELIGDPRFVLVGRGIYALKDQGFTPGVVADVIREAIMDAGGALGIDEIVQKVLARRQVKRNTVIANLQNRDLFKKVGKGTYGLA